MKNKKKLILILLLILFTISIVHKQMQNDVFFTIKTGQYILKHGINNVEPFTMHSNLKFIKLRWAFDVLIYLIYSIGNFNGIYLFTLVISCIIAITLFNLIIKNNVNMMISFILSIVIISNYSLFFTARAQLISYLIFLLEIYFLYKLFDTKDKKYTIILIFLSILLVNFHSSVWLVYIIFFLPFIFESIRKKNKLFIFTHFITILTAFISPLGLSPYTYIPKVIHSYSKVIITELQPLPLIKSIILFIILFLPIIICFIKKRKLKSYDILFLIGCYIMAIMAKRNLYIALMAMPIPITNIYKNFNFKIKTDNLLTYIILSLIIISLSLNNYLKIKNEIFIPNSVYPVSAVNYINKKMNKDEIKIFNDFNYGSYLEFNDIKTFIDSRSEIYCEEFNNSTILKEWAKFNNYDEKEIYNIIKKYKITHLLVKRNMYYKDYLYYNDDFELLYEDEYFLLYKVKTKKLL